MRLDEASGPWSYHNGRWRHGASWIEPFHHPVLESLAFMDGLSVCIVVRERQAGVMSSSEQTTPIMLTHQTYHEMLRTCHMWPLNALIVEITSDDVRLHAAIAPVAPIYLTVQEHTLFASWTLTDLRPFLQSNALVDREVARQLSGHNRYGHDTLFEGVYHLTAGSTGLSVLY